MKLTANLPVIALSISVSIILSACGGGGNNAKKVKDTKAPVITLKGANPLTIIINKPFTDPGATAEDDIDGDISNKITQTNTIKTNQLGCYTQLYKVSDAAGNKANATRLVSVDTKTALNHAPYVTVDSATTVFNKAIKIDVLKNDSDIDCDKLKIVSVKQGLTGKATINADNTITFDPQNTVASHAFEYTVSDGHGATDSTIVTVAAPDPNDGNSSWPDLHDDTATTSKNKSVFIDVLANDKDGDGDTVILDMVDQGQHGSTKKQNNGILYTPDDAYIGTDTFYYGAHDGHGHNGSAKITVTIKP